MLKKWLVIAAVLCISLPLVANAASWSLNTWVRTTGGNIVSRNQATPQTNLNGNIFKTYTTSKSIPVSVNAATGFTISTVTKNSVAVPEAVGQTSYSTTASGPLAQSVWATFAVVRLTITTSAGPGGSVTPPGTGTYNFGAQSPPLLIAFNPLPGNRVIDITGLPSSGFALTDNATGLPVTLPAPINVAVRVTITNLTSSLTLGGVFINFIPVVANAGLPQTVLVGSIPTVVLDGSNSSGPITTYSWVQTAGPVSVTLSNANSATATFPLPSAVGTYNFGLTVTGSNNSSTATAIVYVTNSAAEAAWNQCGNCHAKNNVGQNPNIFRLWSASRHEQHKPTAVMCYNCHVGANTGGHPGPRPVVTVWNACSTCHIPGNTWGLPWPPPGLTFHNKYTGTNLCYECHNPHNPSLITGMPYPHFANSTTSAQYVNNPNISCDNCHTAVDAQGNYSFNIWSANTQWARTGKANPKSPAWMTYQFKSMGTPAPATPATSTANDCVRCHTTTGYITYVDSDFTNIAPFGPPLGSREMIACSACHYTPFNSYVDPETGTAFNRRVVGIDTYGDGSQFNVPGYFGYSSVQSGKYIWKKVFEDAGDSNICITCHTGKAAGSNITTVAGKVGATNAFWQNVTFINPHYMPAASILYQEPPNRGVGFRIGYEYRTFTAYNPVVGFAHPAVGDGVQGPCVGCHMDGSVQKHLFTPVSSSQGVIKGITSTTCFSAYCHDNSGFDGSFLQSKKEGYQASMSVIAAQLGAKGIYFNPAVYPYFFTTSVPAQQNFATRTLNWIQTINNPSGTPVVYGSAVMGAAFNLKLLQADAGSWTHNSVYTKRLLYDTIDFLDDGVQNDSVFVTIQNMSSIDQTTKTRAQAYITPRR